jgi:hypothetical protein
MEHFGRLQGCSDPEPVIDYNDPEAATEFFSHELGQVLSGLARFTNLKKLCVQVDDLSQVFEIEEIESSFTCRRDSPWPLLELIGKSFDALSQNQPGTFVSLAIPRLAIVETEAFQQPRWQQILTHLKEFSFSWPAGCNPKKTIHWYAAVNSYYLARHFFDFLSVVENFRIDGNRNCIPGEWLGGSMKKGNLGAYSRARIRGGNYPGQPPGMPCLRRVHFSWTVLDNDLVGLILKHLHNLEVIKLDYCIGDRKKMGWPNWGYTSHSDEPSMWLILMGSIIKAKPQRLKSFELPGLRDWDHLINLRMRQAKGQKLEPQAVMFLEAAQPAWERNERLFLIGWSRPIDEPFRFRKADMARSISEGALQRAYEDIVDMTRSNVQQTQLKRDLSG